MIYKFYIFGDDDKMLDNLFLEFCVVFCWLEVFFICRFFDFVNLINKCYLSSKLIFDCNLISLLSYSYYELSE